MNRDFYSDVYTILIINMDHMRISVTEPSSVILSQAKKFKSWNVMSEKCQIKLKPKRDGVINPQNNNFQSI